MAIATASSPVDVVSEKETIQDEVEAFVQSIRKRQKKNKNRRHQTLQDCIAKAPSVTDDMIEVFFEKDLTYTVSEQVVSEVKNVLKGMQKKINLFPAKKRLFILETVDLFSSKISLGKLIPALLVLKGIDQKKAICELVFPTFFSINNNIETLVSDNRLFDSQRLHIERGSLYSFGNNISTILVKLFKPDFMARNRDNHSPMEFILKAFDPSSFLINPSIKSEKEYIFQEMIDNENYLRKIILQFIITIQSHKTLYIYSQKRHLYYQLFLMGLTKKNRFKGANPLDVSKILAGCMLATDQIAPDEELINSMLDADEYNHRSTEESKKEFFENLTPKQTLKLISRFKYGLQHIYKSSFEKDFFEVQGLSLKNTLKSIWQGLVLIVEKSIATMVEISQPVLKVFQQIRTTYDSFVRQEEEEEIKEIQTVIRKKPIKPAETVLLFHSKNIESFAIMTQHFALVDTDIASFRGEHEGAGYTDYIQNSQLFNKNRRVLKCLMYTLQRMFKLLQQNENVKIITFEKQPKIREFYAAYAFDNNLLCFGITHIKKTKEVFVDEKDLFPYLLMFTEGNRKIQNRIWSRVAIFKEKLKIYNTIPVDEKSRIQMYEALYLILHLLPEKDWGVKSTQICVDFLVKELQQYKQMGGKLKYCISIPKPT